jgi:hypothetical protein
MTLGMRIALFNTVYAYLMKKTNKRIVIITVTIIAVVAVVAVSAKNRKKIKNKINCNTHKININNR